MTAGGGSQGSVPDLRSMITMGAIGGGTDSGHGPGSDFGVIQETNTLDTGKITDWIGRSNGLAVRLAKEIARTYYGSPVSYTYWQGFSGGGHMGWTQVTQYPEEYDGALIGAPAADWQQFRLADSWDEIVRKKVAQQTDPITQGQMTAATAAAVAACDGDDGVRDGLLGDPRSCTWSATNNICGAAGAPAAPNCVNRIQANGIDTMWDGPRNSHGLRIWYPYDRGINLGTSTTTQASTVQVMRWNRADLTFDGNNLYQDRESIALAAAAGVDVTNAVTYEQEAVLTAATTARLTSGWQRDITRARDLGLKIMVYHGTADSAIQYRNDVDRYRQAARYYGTGQANFAAIQDWYRLFLVPGMGHSAQPFLPELMAWVEDGVAPDRIARTSGFPVVCSFPQKAIYRGSGSTSDANNYTCGGNLDADPVALCQMPSTKFGLEDKAALNTSETGIPPGQCKKS
ncbi:tannase/feruloyl esterase family alpha/beta hydrolase [Rhizomonospora bruguierae]|uniref:tannase/feruloyl esterase family alpha/beta hydrolase n=1 Tax=Rhizomonospora bruguierae TaxID=1581705 RepID=UPI001BCC2887|nr:tannase/feruloyl esterase family alpha/beta hydrolase [Micromonospora sp. NBRC 107566]